MTIEAAQKKRDFLAKSPIERCEEIGAQFAGLAAEKMTACWSDALLRVAGLGDVYDALEASVTGLLPHENPGVNYLAPFQVFGREKLRIIKSGLFQGEQQRLVILYRGDWQNLTIKDAATEHVVVAILDDQNALVCVSHVILQKVRGGKFQTNLLRNPTGGESHSMKLSNQRDLTDALRQAHEAGRLPNVQDWRAD